MFRKINGKNNIHKKIRDNYVNIKYYVIITKKSVPNKIYPSYVMKACMQEMVKRVSYSAPAACSVVIICLNLGDRIGSDKQCLFPAGNKVKGQLYALTGSIIGIMFTCLCLGNVLYRV
jgi:hypothetical protein